MVFQPQVALVVGEEVLAGDGNGVRVGRADVAGKQEEVSREDKRAALVRDFQVTQLLEVFAAQCLRGGFLLLGYLEVLEMVPLGEALLVGNPADPFQQSQVVPRGLVGIPAFHFDVGLVFPDELFVQRAESDVLHLVLFLDKLAERLPRIMVGAHGGRADINADALPRFFDVTVEQPEQGHLGFHASLEEVPHVRSAEIAFPFLQFIERRMDGQQQFFNFRIGLHRLAALSFQAVFTHVPQLGRARGLVLNCATVRFNVMRPMMGALPDLSGSVFFKNSKTLNFSIFIRLHFLFAKLVWM